MTCSMELGPDRARNLCHIDSVRYCRAGQRCDRYVDCCSSDVCHARFDNQSGSSERASVEKQTQPRRAAPASLIASADFIEATIWSEQADHPAWGDPVRVYFRRDGAAWRTVGLTRTITYGSQR
jgi:hypothetical protein